MRPTLVSAFVIAAAVAGAGPASAQRAIQGPLTRVDFTGYAGLGLVPSPGPGQLDSNEFRVTGMSEDSVYGGTYTTGDFAEGASDGGVSGEGTGGMWAFSTSPGDPAFGMQPSGADFTPGDVFLRFVNETGAPVVDPTLRYELWVYNDASRSSRVDFAWSIDGVQFEEVPALTVITPEAADPAPAWVLTPRSVALSGVTIAPGALLHLRWAVDYESGSGGYDEMAIDDIEVELEVLPPACGDGVLDVGEGCDDGGTASGDGCSAECAVEDGWTCTGQPSSCTEDGAGGGDGGVADDDQDGDGIPDDQDNCPTVPNPSQADENGNGIGNACEELAGDDDGYAAGCAVGGGGGAGMLVLGLLYLLHPRRRRLPP